MNSSDTTRFDLQKHIDHIAIDFERQWRDGMIPSLEKFLNRIESAGRSALLRELAIIELHYRQVFSGEPITAEEFCQIHSELKRENLGRLIDELQNHPVEQIARKAQKTREGLLDSSEETPVHKNKQSSRGLHIRCPHCSNPVELIENVSVDSITCLTCGSAFSLINDEATRQAPVLKTAGRFEIVGRLGVGGFGTVWKARDPELDRAVAIKIPRKGQLDLDEAEDFLKEARTVARLHHPNIVPVYEIGRDGDTIFIVSELVRGVSLSDWLTVKTPSYVGIAELLMKIARALDHAHQKGIIHRDLKPSNILIDEHGEPLVMDFGLAKRDGHEIAATLDGRVIGTPAYMSPEQAAGNSKWVDRRMDIYSMGVILFRMLTGELPFRGNAQMQIHQRLNEDAPDPRGLNRYIPRDLSTVCLKCLERDPNRRYATASQLAEEFGRFLRGEPIQARPVSKVERVIRWAKRKPAAATALALGTVLAIGGPTLAIAIERSKQRVVALGAERDNLIKKREHETREAIDRATKLQSKLDVWEGRVVPSDMWPPDPDNPPKKLQLQSLLNSSATLLEANRQGESALEKAQRTLALATCYEVTNQLEPAKAALVKASMVLESMEADSLSLPIQMELANCFERLATLTLKANREESDTWRARALDLRRRMAQQNPKDPALVALRLDTELIAGAQAGFDDTKDNLQMMQEIHESLKDLWPQSVADIYRLTCLLANRQPLLLDGSLMGQESVKVSSD